MPLGSDVIEIERASFKQPSARQRPATKTLFEMVARLLELNVLSRGWHLPPESAKNKPQILWRDAPVRNVPSNEQIEVMLRPYRHLTEATPDEEGEVRPRLDARTWNLARDVVGILAAKIAPPMKPPVLDAASSGNAHILWQWTDHFVLIIVDAKNSEIKWFVKSRKGEDSKGPFDPSDISPTLLANLAS